jgi:predicted nucleic acid-binding protein
MTVKDHVFIDTNLWIYGLTESQQPDERDKHYHVVSLLQTLTQTAHIHVSLQVLNECHWNLMKKFQYHEQDVHRLIEENILPISMVEPLTLETYQQSFTYRTRYCFSFWDSLIVASAIEHHCLFLYTEDMQHQQHIKEGNLTLINPFL